jgi:hypothetical protein
LRLIHSECGGALEIDYRTLPVQISNAEIKDATDVYYGVCCSNCHEPLGLLANIDQEGARVH